MIYLGILILCGVASFLLIILTGTTKGERAAVKIGTWIVLMGILYGLTLAVMLGIKLIVGS